MIICNLHMIYSPYGCAIDAGHGGKRQTRNEDVCMCECWDGDDTKCVCVFNGGEMSV